MYFTYFVKYKHTVLSRVMSDIKTKISGYWLLQYHFKIFKRNKTDTLNLDIIVFSFRIFVLPRSRPKYGNIASYSSQRDIFSRKGYYKLMLNFPFFNIWVVTYLNISQTYYTDDI